MAKKLKEGPIINLPSVVVTPRANYIQYTGEESNTPTIEDYYDARARETAINAAYNILNQEAPLVPVVPALTFTSRAAGLFGMPDSERIARYGVLADPLTCIYTATGMYNNPEDLVSGNVTFAKNPLKYGFIEVPNDNSLIGDLVQFNRRALLGLIDRPHHSTIVTGYNLLGLPTLSYSNGESTEWTTDDEGNKIHSMKYDNDNWNTEWNRGPRDTWDWSSLYSIGTPHTFRFIGSSSDKKNWSKEYNSKYKKANGGYIPTLQDLERNNINYQKSTNNLPSVRFDNGGLLKKWEELSMHERGGFMRTAVRNGIRDIEEIKRKYNEFINS